MGISREHNDSADASGRQPDPTRIRRAGTEDAAAVGTLLASALAAKYRPTLGRRAGEALAHVIRDELASPRHGYWVAERAGGVIGAAHLATAEDDPPAHVIRRLSDVVGWTRAIWALAALSILAHGPLDPDEAYVGEVAVAAQARRQGVAAALMTRLDAHAQALGKSRVTLWVTDDNVPARALYEGLGFTECTRRSWRVGRFVFGSRGAVLMEKRLTPTGAASGTMPN